MTHGRKNIKSIQYVRSKHVARVKGTDSLVWLAVQIYLTMRVKRRLRMFENRVLRRIFGPATDKVTEEWRKLHNEELNYLYSSPNSIRVIKSRRMRWAGQDRRIQGFDGDT